jgi:hypothetical protein
VIAKGNRIRDVQRLVHTYGGRASRWVKKSSPRFEIAGHQYNTKFTGTNIPLSVALS